MVPHLVRYPSISWWEAHLITRIEVFRTVNVDLDELRNPSAHSPRPFAPSLDPQCSQKFAETERYGGDVSESVSRFHLAFRERSPSFGVGRVRWMMATMGCACHS